MEPITLKEEELERLKATLLRSLSLQNSRKTHIYREHAVTNDTTSSDNGGKLLGYGTEEVSKLLAILSNAFECQHSTSGKSNIYVLLKGKSKMKYIIFIFIA